MKQRGFGERLLHTGELFLQADEELLKLNMGDLPGVGWQMQKKLEKLGLPTVADIRNSRRELLQRELGAKSGSMASRPLLFGLHLSLLHGSTTAKLRHRCKQACTQTGGLSRSVVNARPGVLSSQASHCNPQLLSPGICNNMFEHCEECAGVGVCAWSGQSSGGGASGAEVHRGAGLLRRAPGWRR